MLNTPLRMQLKALNTNHASSVAAKLCTLGGETSRVVHCEVKP